MDKVAEVLPEPIYLDRTGPDRDRFIERIRPQITKDHIKELLRRGGDFFQGVWVSGAHQRPQYVPLSSVDLPIGAASLPIGIGEPRWRPGRDRPGSGGGGPDASNDPADLVYLNIEWEELADLLALLFDLPWLQAKDADKILAYTMKVRGQRNTGPEARKIDEATFIARLERFRTMYNAHPEDFPDLSIDDIPTVEQFPYSHLDDRFKRVEERWDPDSKAVVFFEFDTSASMGGEPMAIARFYFLLNLVWLRGRYGQIDVVFIAHNAEAFRVESEQDFFRITDGGGTMFSPAHELCMTIAAEQYPASIYDRYAFHATDGYNFEPAPFLAEVIERMVTEGLGDFKLFGYLQIALSGWGWGRQTSGLQAIELIGEPARSHIGVAFVSSQDEVPEAMRQIVAINTAATG